jgi:hypothetical protein
MVTKQKKEKTENRKQKTDGLGECVCFAEDEGGGSPQTGAVCP